MQNWRAVAHLHNGKEALVILGSSQYQINNTYQEAFLEVIHPDLQATCRGVSMQKWRGRPDAGRWINAGSLKMPGL